MRVLVCLVCLVELLASVSSASASGVPRREVEALQRVHASTRGDSWLWRDEALEGVRWNFSADASGDFLDDPCSSAWQGVNCSHPPTVCSSQTCHITELVLQRYSLNGSIPSEVGNLEQLQVLDLDNNDLTGTLPNELFQLLSLKTLALYDNLLTGSIPALVGNLTNLQALNLYGNALNESIPVEIGDLVNLEWLGLGRNGLSGSIPKEIGQLTKLESLTLFQNLLTGRIPVEIGQLVGLEWFDAISNSLTGSIPPELGRLVNLQGLYLQFNEFNGSIPSEVGHLVNLRFLSFNNNSLTGSIPSEIGNLIYLRRLFLFHNSLSGPIPPAIGQLVNLEMLILYKNFLSGSIPREIGVLRNLRQMHLGANKLTGILPPEVGQMQSLTAVDFYQNFLTGSIPSEVSLLTNLRWLYCGWNYFSGPIPSYVSSMVNLEVLDVRHNFLSGHIPVDVGELLQLASLTLDFNAFSGSIPAELCNLVRLVGLYLENNALTGSIPSMMGNLVNLKYLYLNHNALSGVIPPQIGLLPDLQRLYMQSNAFIGRIPHEVGYLVYLQQIDLSNNALTGPIPSSMGNLVSVGILNLQSNRLSGSIPRELRRMASLLGIFLQSNRLTSGFEDVFSPSGQKLLEVVDMSDNLLSGSFGEDVFGLPSLRVLVLSVNCFESPLSTLMCDASEIEVISFNGLGAATDCEDSYTFPGSGVVLFNTIGGTLPECVWSLRRLSVLHAVGNGISGELIPRLPNTSRITDLSISHNKFSGTIPQGIMMIRRVDLSYNQFTSKEFGEVSETSSQRVLDLEINRMSGRLPVSTLQNVSSLNVLRGNMVSCDTLPENDEFNSEYICGSSDLNESNDTFVAALSFTGFVLIMWFVMSRLGTDSSVLLNKGSKLHALWRVSTQATRLRGYFDYVSGEESKCGPRYQPIMSLCRKTQTTSKLFIQLFVLSLVVGVPVYILRGSDSDTLYSTHVDTYMWFWTLAYLRGTLPAALVLVAWAVTLSACYYRILLCPTIEASTEFSISQVVDKKNDSLPSSSSECDMKNEANIVGINRKDIVWPVIVVFVNISTSVTVNSLYIYSSQQALNPAIFFSIQSSLAVYRLLYSTIVIPYMASYVTDAVLNIRLRTRLLAISEYVIPCAVTLFGSLSCFQGLLVEDEAVSTPYMMRTCVEAAYLPSGIECRSWIPQLYRTTAVIPPFVYNNQCTSVLLTSFIPVIVIGLSIQLVTTLAIPLLSFRANNWFPEWTMTLMRLKWLPGILWPHMWVNSDTSQFVSDNRAMLEDDPTILFESEPILCFDVLNNILIMLTFGLCSPVLATAAMLVAVARLKVFELLIGRFSAILDGDEGSSGNNKVHGVHYALVILCRVWFPLREVLQQTFWVLAGTSALFFSLLCWDMACDEVGWQDSVWAFIVALSFPIVLRIIDHFFVNGNGKEEISLLYDYITRDSSKKCSTSTSSERPTDVEMTEVSMSSSRSVLDANSNGQNPMHVEP